MAIYKNEPSSWTATNSSPNVLPTVIGSVSNLEDLLNELSGILIQLEDKLAPGLTPSGSEVQKDNNYPSSSVELIRRLDSIHSGFMGIRECLLSICQRIVLK